MLVLSAVKIELAQTQGYPIPGNGVGVSALLKGSLSVLLIELQFASGKKNLF